MLDRFTGSLAFCLLLGALTPLTGCASDAEETDEGGAAATVDLASAKIVEQSRFRRAGRLIGTNDGRSVRAYRVNGFGSTKVRIEVKPKTGSFAPLVALAGPIPGDERVVTSKRGTRNGGTVIETTLAARGAYRILVGTQASFAGRAGDAGDFEIAYTCLANCDLPEVSLAEVVNDLKSSVGPERLRGSLEQLVSSYVPAEEGRAELMTSIDALIASPQQIEAIGLPVLPLHLGAIAQGIPGGQEEATPPAPPAQTIELATIGESCRPNRPDPSAARELLPGLALADVPDFTYDDCALAKMEGLAAALNALSLQNGSMVVDGDARYTKLTDFVDALIQKGHHVVVDNARYYADFLGLNYKGRSVRAPVWIDTGIPLTGGGTLRTPAPHAHHNIWISGPRFDGQLKFFMGVDDGTAFRTQGNIPRGWSGERVIYTIDSATQAADVVRVLGVAGDLRRKWQTAGAGLPMQGYGKLGVCTDSTAVLEHAYRQTVTLFPLANPESDARADAIDQILAELPSDVGTPGPNAVERMAQSIPFEDVSKVPFPAFRDQWAKLAR